MYLISIISEKLTVVLIPVWWFKNLGCDCQ